MTFVMSRVKHAAPLIVLGLQFPNSKLARQRQEIKAEARTV
jgi:hypothetical protein